MFLRKAGPAFAGNAMTFFCRKGEKMPKFSKRSKKELATAHPDLQRLFNEVIKTTDCAVVCGHRGRDDQEKAFAEGFSRLRWPDSKHNKVPSLAVDVIPFPAGYSSVERFEELAAVVKETAKRLKISVEWGGSWKRFVDRPHWQLPK